MRNWGLGVVAIVLVAVLFFLFKLKKPADSISQIPQENQSASSNEVRLKSAQEVEAEKKTSTIEVQKRQENIRWDRAQRNVGLSTYPLTIRNGVAVLELEIEASGSCFPGDANAIAMDLKASPSHKLLATLEIFSGQGKSSSWDVPKTFFTAGKAEHEFLLPATEEPAQYGFYLCTANASDTSCQSKAVKDINDIFTEHIQKDPKAGKEPRNIFFQYFMVDERGLTAFADVPKSSQRFEELKKYLRERKSSEQSVDATKKNSLTLASLPFKFDGRKLKVQLPEYRPEACAPSDTASRGQ